MFSKNKWIISLLAIALFSVTACSTTETPTTQSVSQKEAVPPMPQVPVLQSFAEMAPKEIETNRQYVASQIVKKDGKTKYFFNQDKDLVKKKVANGYYRVVLGKTAAGNCAVQDFYADTNTKKSEPFIVAKKDCNILYRDGYDGAVILYDKQQHLEGIVIHFKDGKAINVLAGDNDFTMYIDIADEPKNTIIEKENDFGMVFKYVFNNDEIQEFSAFMPGDSINEPNRLIVMKIRYVNGKADPANSYFWRDGEGMAYNQELLDYTIKKVEKRISNATHIKCN